MIKRSFAGAFGAIALAGALLAGAMQVQAARERVYPTLEVEEDAVYITSGSAVRRLTGTYNALAADVYWIRAIQYYGGAKRRLTAPSGSPQPPPPSRRTNESSQLYPPLDITTSLHARVHIAQRV